MKDELLTVNQVAELFRVNRTTVYGWMNRGLLKPACRTPSGRYRFSRAALMAAREDMAGWEWKIPGQREV